MATNFKVGDKVKFKQHMKDTHEEVKAFFGVKYPAFDGIYTVAAVYPMLWADSEQTQMVDLVGYEELAELVAEGSLGGSWFEVANVN